MHSDLLKNAVESIENGVNDFTSGEARRVTSSLRNLYAGVLLLLKEKLRRLSPPNTNEVLIRMKFEPRLIDGNVHLIGAGKKTVDYGEIRERFEALELRVDWQRLDRLQRLRNSAEHHIASEPKAVMQEAIANTFLLVADVLVEHLNLVPAKVLDQHVWNTMLAETETHRALENRCHASRIALENIPEAARRIIERTLGCSECGSTLLRATSTEYGEDATFECMACGGAVLLNEILQDGIDRAYGFETHRAVRDGDEPPIGTCPNCYSETYSLEDDVCLSCGEGRPHSTCGICGNSLTLDESDESRCSYCRHLMSKDD